MDRTVQLVRGSGLATHLLANGTRSRAAQMNAGAAAANGDVLVFLHADTRPPAELVCDN
jgi:hypothetical protein